MITVKNLKQSKKLQLQNISEGEFFIDDDGDLCIKGPRHLNTENFKCFSFIDDAITRCSDVLYHSTYEVELAKSVKVEFS